MAKAAAESSNLSLYKYVGGVNAKTLPVPMMNILNGGSHADNSIDLVTWILGPHELGFAPDGKSLGDPETSFTEIARILKPGGVFLAIDHDAVKGSGLEVGGTIHRGDEVAITALANAAGLTLADSSDLLKNADDDLTAMVFSPNVRGKTSRFVLRFEK